MIVADSDVLIDYLRGADPVAEQVEREIGQGLATTAITAFELWAGAAGSTRRERAVEDLLSALVVLPLDATAARVAGQTRSDLAGKGREIGMGDSLIAGICLVADAALWTGNTRHFARVHALRLAPT